MDIHWMGPALRGAYERREEIESLLERGMTYLFGKKTSIAVTGMSGVGKTVLLHHLNGEAFRRSYQLPLQSQAKETATVRNAGKRLRLTVVPGQDATPRHQTLEQLFGGKTPVQGVIQVVGYGFATTRSEVSIRTMIQDRGLNTLKKYRQYQLKEEEADLKEVCEAIRTAHQKSRSPAWLLLAVDKIDLYHDGIEKARDWYSPDGAGPIVTLLQTLASRIGTDNFRWDAIPVCGHIEPFHWHTEDVAPQLDTATRDGYIAQFLRVLANYGN